MDQLINEAVGAHDSPPPKKKARIEPVIEDEVIEEEEEEPGFLSIFKKPADLKSLRRELKRVLLKHPNVELGKYTEVDDFVDSLDIHQIKAYLEEANFKIEVGTKNLNGVAFLGILGDWLNFSCGKKGMTQVLLADEELVDMIDELIPSDYSWLSKPFQVVSRILYHINKTV